MPAKPERTFRNRVTKQLHNSIDTWSVHDSFTAGVPDHWYSGWKADLWAEYKYFPKSKNKFNLVSGKAPKLSMLQQHWLNRKLKQGRNVCVIVGFPQGALVLDNGEWMNEITEVENKIITVKELAREIEKRCGLYK